MADDLDLASWFHSYGTCSCGKPATGAVMSQKNDIMARTCTACGHKRVARAQSARELAVKIATQLEDRYGKR